MSAVPPCEPIQVRSATLADVAAIARCHTRSIRLAYQNFLAASDSAIFTEDQAAARLAQQIASRDNVLVALSEGFVIGHARWGEIDADYWPYQVLVHSLFIDPDHQRVRAGSALLAECALGAHRRGFVGMMIGAFVENRPALDWYSRQGGRLIETAPLEVGSNPYLSAFLAFDDLDGLREQLTSPRKH